MKGRCISWHSKIGRFGRGERGRSVFRKEYNGENEQDCDKPSWTNDGRPFWRVLSTQEVKWGQILEGIETQLKQSDLAVVGSHYRLWSSGACLEKFSWGNLAWLNSMAWKRNQHRVWVSARRSLEICYALAVPLQFGRGTFQIRMQT